MAAKPIAAMVLGVPTAPTGTHKLIGAITPRFAARQRDVRTKGISHEAFTAPQMNHPIAAFEAFAANFTRALVAMVFAKKMIR
jgi:hypothetical protein